MKKGNTHEDFSRASEMAEASDRAFGLVFTAVFALLAGWPLIHGHPIRWWALAVSGVFLLATLSLPRILHPLNHLWTRFGILCNRLMTPLITGLLFYCVITPVAFVFRLRRKDSLCLRGDPGAPTYWHRREPPGPAPETMVNQF